MAALFDLLREGYHRSRRCRPTTDQQQCGVHDRIDAGGFGGKIVLLPWLEPE